MPVSERHAEGTSEDISLGQIAGTVIISPPSAVAPASVPISISVPIVPAVPIARPPAIGIISGVIGIRAIISGTVISDDRALVIIPADDGRAFDDRTPFFVASIVAAKISGCRAVRHKTDHSQRRKCANLSFHRNAPCRIASKKNTTAREWLLNAALHIDGLICLKIIAHSRGMSPFRG
jgi:hypothetical protein